jgi:hypothetical protein
VRHIRANKSAHSQLPGVYLQPSDFPVFHSRTAPRVVELRYTFSFFRVFAEPFHVQPRNSREVGSCGRAEPEGSVESKGGFESEGRLHARNGGCPRPFERGLRVGHIDDIR